MSNDDSYKGGKKTQQGDVLFMAVVLNKEGLSRMATFKLRTG